jgi:hypothetical protein
MDTNPLERLYGVFAKPQTYLNLLYLLLAFPLGLAYFVFLVTGLSLGVGLLILWVGLLILAGVLALCWPLALFERQLAISLLKVKIPLLNHPQEQAGTIFQQVKNHLSNPVTWKGIAFLFLKFPIGLASFIVTTTLGAVSLGLILAPLTYQWVHINIGLWRINSMSAAAIACVLGCIVAPFSLHIFNLLADWSGKLAIVMLGNPSPAETRSDVIPPAMTAPLT